jgi:hypothetical protein
MAVITAAAFSKAVYPKPFTGWMGLAYEMYPDLVSEMMMLKNSDQSIEEDTLLTGLGVMINVAEGQSTIYDSMSQGATQQYTFLDWRAGFQITKNAIRDGKGLKLAEEGSKQLGIIYNETRNLLAANLYNHGFDGTVTSADGSTLIGTHSTISGSYSNQLSTNAALSEASIEQIVIDLKQIKNDRGIRQMIRPIDLLIPPQLEFEASRYINSEYRADTSDNTISAINRKGLFAGQAKIIDYFTNTKAYFIKTNITEHGPTFWLRQKLEISNDTRFDSDNAAFKSHFRAQTGCSEWRALMGSQGL